MSNETEYEVFLKGALIFTTSFKAERWLMPGKDFVWSEGKRYPITAVSGTRITVDVHDKEVQL